MEQKVEKVLKAFVQCKVVLLTGLNQRGHIQLDQLQTTPQQNKVLPSQRLGAQTDDSVS